MLSKDQEHCRKKKTTPLGITHAISLDHTLHINAGGKAKEPCLSLTTTLINLYKLTLFP